MSLRWDAWDRLVRVTDTAGPIVEYQYDPRGFRIASHTYRDPAAPDTVLTTPNIRHFYHNARWQVLEERTAHSPTLPSLHYIWSLRYIDAPILRDRRVLSSPTTLSERLYYLGDANFNVAALISPAGAVQERYTYTPYGEPSYFSSTWQPRVSSAFDNTILYTGRELDSAIGVYYFRTRWYECVFGTFGARDLIHGGANLYRYCRSNPVRFRDPKGTHIYVEVGNDTANLLNDLFHEAICVDVWDSCQDKWPRTRRCFSFGVVGTQWPCPSTTWLGFSSWQCCVLRGMIFEDPAFKETGKGVVRLKRTSCAQDVKWLDYILGRVGMEDGYSVGRHSCRTFANLEFDAAPGSVSESRVRLPFKADMERREREDAELRRQLEEETAQRERDPRFKYGVPGGRIGPPGVAP